MPGMRAIAWRKKLSSLLDVPLKRALNGIPISLCSRMVGWMSNIPVAGSRLAKNSHTQHEITCINKKETTSLYKNDNNHEPSFRFSLASVSIILFYLFCTPIICM